MKTIFMSLVAMGFAGTALAMPTVGDQALYSLNMTNGGQAITGTLEQLITANDAGMFTVQTTVNDGKSNQVQNDKKAASDLLSTDLVTQILANCAAYGGQPANITVAA